MRGEVMPDEAKYILAVGVTMALVVLAVCFGLSLEQPEPFDSWFAQHKQECMRCDSPDASLCGEAFFRLQEELRQLKDVPRADIADALHFERITPEYGVRHVPVDPDGVQVLEEGAALLPPPDPYFESTGERAEQ